MAVAAQLFSHDYPAVWGSSPPQNAQEDQEWVPNPQVLPRPGNLAAPSPGAAGSLAWVLP